MVAPLPMTPDAPLPMTPDAPHWAYGDDIGVLPRIFEDGITLAVMERALPVNLRDSVAAQLTADARLDWRWRGAPGEAMRADLRQRLPVPERAAALLDDIGTIASALAFLFDTATIGIRLRLLDEAMCPRFHVDNLAVRLVTTYAGPGSEWLPEHAVNRAGLGAPRADKPEIVTDPAAIGRLGVGDLALLKGDGWIGNEGRGLVHRSPRPAPGQRRLLLALDPG